MRYARATVKRNMRESRQARARRLRQATEQRFAAHMVNAIRALTGMVQASAERMRIAAIGPFADLAECMGERLDSTRRTLAVARDEALSREGSGA